MLKKILTVLCLLAVFSSCGKKDSGGGAVVAGAPAPIDIGLGGGGVPIDISQACAYQNGSLISLNGTSVCRITTNYSFGANWSFNFGDSILNTPISVFVNDRVQVTNSSGNIIALFVGGYPQSNFNSFVSTTSGYLSIEMSGWSSYSINGVQVTRCFDGNNTTYICP